MENQLDQRTSPHASFNIKHFLANQYISGKIYNTISYTQSVIQKVGKLQNQLLINK